MSDYTELNSKADAALSEIAESGERWPEGQDWFEPELCSAGLELVKAANPNAIKALIAENEALRNAAVKVIEMNRQHAKDQYGDSDKAESWSCVTVLRAAMGKGEQS